AQAKGYNPNNWDSVTSSLAMEETYTFSQTVRYVEEVMERYQNYQILLY
ncbi:MAG: hypothetical protein HUJ90_02525, partial [Bacteroidales bacterium]|nr:hypothetical protein [Bacteroidales bacterium]